MKRKLKIEDHEKIGKSIKSIRVAIMQLRGIICREYGKTSKQAKSLMKALEAISNAKAELADALVTEFPDAPEAKIYFGDASAPEDIAKLLEGVGE